MENKKPEVEISPEMQVKLQRVSKLSKELEELLAEVMIPSDLKSLPSIRDIENRIANFFTGSINNVMFLATMRVNDLYPEKAEAARKKVTTLIEQILGLKVPSPTLPADKPISKKLN